jgi:membrane peptidoglycan carboxypeptidase
MAKKAGVRGLDGKPIDQMIPKAENRIGIGEYGVTPLDNADGFATFAAGGKHAAPYFVESVTRPGDSKPRYQHTPNVERAFDEDIAADATDVMKGVVKNADPLDDREAAGKTGTVQYGDTGGANSHAWMAGYTPQLAAAVWVGRTKGDGPIKTKDGGNIFGAGLPSDTWKVFMDAALDGLDAEDLPDAANVGDDEKGGELPEVSEPDEDDDKPEPKPSDNPEDPNPKPSLPFPRPSDTDPPGPSPSFPGGRD